MVVLYISLTEFTFRITDSSFSLRWRNLTSMAPATHQDFLLWHEELPWTPVILWPDEQAFRDLVGTHNTGDSGWGPSTRSAKPTPHPDGPTPLSLRGKGEGMHPGWEHATGKAEKRGSGGSSRPSKHLKDTGDWCVNWVQTWEERAQEWQKNTHGHTHGTHAHTRGTHAHTHGTHAHTSYVLEIHGNAVGQMKLIT